MRNDGRLFSLTKGDTALSSGNYAEFNTASGNIVNFANLDQPLDDQFEDLHAGLQHEHECHAAGHRVPRRTIAACNSRRYRLPARGWQHE